MVADRVAAMIDAISGRVNRMQMLQTMVAAEYIQLQSDIQKAKEYVYAAKLASGTRAQAN